MILVLKGDDNRIADIANPKDKPKIILNIILIFLLSKFFKKSFLNKFRKKKINAIINKSK